MLYQCIILGAGGRDFHELRTFFAAHPEFRVRALTARKAQDEPRVFPRELAGPTYDYDIPIYPESQLPELVRQFEVDFVFLAYGGLSPEEVLHRASLVEACGASFALLGPKHTQLDASRPVVALSAPHEKSIARSVVAHLLANGRRVSVLHANGTRTDVPRELADAESCSDVIVWDGTNEDIPYVRPDVSIVVIDRDDYEYPAETNVRRADILVFDRDSIEHSEHVLRLYPKARIVEGRIHPRFVQTRGESLFSMIDERLAQR